MSEDLHDRTGVITGASAGIGRATAIELARRGARVILACRSEAKTMPVIDAIKRKTGNQAVELVLLNLASLASVRRAAREVLERAPALHLLVNNAGLAGRRRLTEDGFEPAFGVNHLGHFLFTNLLLERLAASAPARIINVASSAHYGAAGIDFTVLHEEPKSRSGFPEYQVSKLANVLFSAELARRREDKGVTTYAVHPGVVASDIWRRIPWPLSPVMKLFMKSPEQGAYSSVYCATSPEVAGETGLYYDADGSKKESSAPARDLRLAEDLWEKSAEWTGL